MTNTIMIIATVFIALWVLFSGGQPFWKHILFRLCFVGWGFLAFGVMQNVIAQYGIAPAVLTALGALLLWNLLIGPIIIAILNMRRITAIN